MKKSILIIALLSSWVFALDWVKNLDTAFEIAKKENKVVMVMVESKYCRWCKKMKHRTLSDEGIEKRLKAYVVVKVMREDTNAMAKLPQINGVPTIFFMTDKKEVIEDVVGYFDVLDFNSYISDVEKKVQESKIK